MSVARACGSRCRKSSRCAGVHPNLHVIRHLRGAVSGASVWRRPLVILAIGASLIAAAADYLETFSLLGITQTLDAPGQLLHYSQLGAWSKFVLLAAHAVFCAGICYTGEKQRLILGSVLMLPAFGVAAAAYDHVALSNVMTGAFALAWVSLLAAAVVSLVRGSAVGA